MKEATGVEFIDRFDRYDEDLWRIEDNQSVCLDEVDGYCVYATRNNVEYLEAHDSVLQLYSEEGQQKWHNYMSIRLIDDCSGPECCDENGVCAKFTGGFVTSLHKYGYGSFRFLARAVSHASGFVSEGFQDAYSCLSIESDPLEVGSSVAISFCVSAADPHLVFISSQHGDAKFVREIQLEVNLQKALALYRIDWGPDSIKWYINGKLLASTDSHESKIPNEPLKIKLGLFPHVPEDRASENYIPVQVTMILFRLRYIEDGKQSADVHDELFVLGSSSSPIFKSIFFVLLTLFAFVIIMSFWKQSKWNDDFENVYVSMNSTPV